MRHGFRRPWHNKHWRVDGGSVLPQLRRVLYAEPLCHYCRKPTPKSQRSIDHVVPLSRGGTHEPDNLVMACKRCNEDKADMTGDEYARVLGRATDGNRKA